MTTYTVGLDIGTSSAKLSVWDNQKEEIILQLTDNYPILVDSRQEARQDPEKIYETVLKLLVQAVEKVDEQVKNENKLMIVVLDTALHTLLLLDRKMCPLSDLIPWMDGRANSIAEEMLKNNLAKEIHKYTGCPVDPVYPLYKLMWFNRNEPDLMKEVQKVASIKDFLLYRLTDRFAIDFSTASGTGYLNIRKRSWAVDLLEDLTGVDSTKLPELISPYELLSPSESVKEVVQSQRVTIKFVAGISDAAASSIGPTCGDLNSVTISMGTSAAVRRISNNPLREDAVPDNGIWCYMVDEEQYIIGLALKNGGCLVDWWAKNFLQINSYDVIGNLLEEITNNKEYFSTSSRIIFIPTVYGTRSPRWIPDRTGALMRLSGTSTIVEATKAVMEGFAFNIKRTLETVRDCTDEDLGEASHIVATGGMCEIRGWLQFLAIVLNTPLISRENKYGASVGSILFYMKDKAQSLFKKLFEKSSMFFPKEEASNFYEELYPVWLNEMRAWEER